MSDLDTVPDHLYNPKQNIEMTPCIVFEKQQNTHTQN